MVNPIDNLRSELQRPGEAWIELLQREFKALRKGIVSDIVTELRHSTRKTPRHRTDPHKEAIARLIQEDPEIRNLQICRQMDKLQEKIVRLLSAAFLAFPFLGGIVSPGWQPRTFVSRFYSARPSIT